jgi:hypothetical protein
MQDLVDILRRHPNRSHIDNHIAGSSLGSRLGRADPRPGLVHGQAALARDFSRCPRSKQAQLVADLRRWAKAARVERVGGALVEAKFAAGAIEPHPEHVGVGPRADHPF